MTMPEEAPELGDGSSFKAQRQQYNTAGGSSPSSQGGAPVPPQGASPTPQQAPPVQPYQPSVTPFPSRPVGQSIQMENVFQKPPQLQEPWRTWLRNQASRPGAGPELKALGAAIDFQRGPLDKQP